MLGQEHLIFYFIKTFQETIKKVGLHINDAELNEMNGGNIVFMCRTILPDYVRCMEKAITLLIS